MRSVYLHLKILFEDTTADEKALMSRTANILFSDLNRVLIEYTILQVCKITDPAKDGRNNNNHTVAFLLQHYDFRKKPEVLASLDELHRKLLAFRQKLLPARNKVISHSDRDTIIAGTALGGAPKSEWDDFWLNLQDFICITHGEVVGGPAFLINDVAMLSDADGLLKALRHSAHFGRLLQDPAISRRCTELLY